MDRPRLLVLGTHNRQKRLELERLLVPLGLELRTLTDFPQALTVAEDGATFAENAARKAVAQACHLRHWVLGEDSGLCVDALNGAPGVFSARFAGPAASDDANNQQLLASLHDVPDAQRTAFYVCHIALADPQGAIRIRSEGTCRGRILRSPRGTTGFGYDPLFEIVEYHRTFAELGETVKSVLSHRARASRALVRQLARLPDQAPCG